MILELTVGTIAVSYFAYAKFVRPRMQQKRIRALMDFDRAAMLANVDSEDLFAAVIGTYQLRRDGKWYPGYYVHFSFRDISTLVNGRRNPFVSLGNTFDVDQFVNFRQLEEKLASHVLEWTQRDA